MLLKIAFAIPLFIHGANRSDMAAGLFVLHLSWPVALADEFDKFTKDMTEFPEPLLVHPSVDEGAESVTLEQTEFIRLDVDDPRTVEAQRR
jgi:hypothetical protein